MVQLATAFRRGTTAVCLPGPALDAVLGAQRGVARLGGAVRQPCRHNEATVRGLPMLTFDQWSGSARASALASTSPFELQQYAAAILAVSPEDPARGDIAKSETGVVAALPPVGNRYSIQRSDHAVSFFSEALRRSILGGGDQP